MSKRIKFADITLNVININIIENSRILDLASHDGRWSFAALMNKASKVVGIEGKRHLVENAKRHLGKYDWDNIAQKIDQIYQKLIL